MPIDQMFYKLSCSLQIIGLNSDFLLFDSGFPNVNRARPEGPRDYLYLTLLYLSMIVSRMFQQKCSISFETNGQIGKNVAPSSDNSSFNILSDLKVWNLSLFKVCRFAAAVLICSSKYFCNFRLTALQFWHFVE